MSWFYVDSSALVKRYLTEVGSAWVQSLLDPGAGHTIIVASVTRVETAAAFAARHRAGAITVAERDALVDFLLHHCATEYQIVDMNQAIISRAVALTQNHRLRGYDAIQLATALIAISALPHLTMISADDDLNVAAQVEGLNASNPQAHP